MKLWLEGFGNTVLVVIVVLPGGLLPWASSPCLRQVPLVVLEGLQDGIAVICGVQLPSEVKMLVLSVSVKVLISIAMVGVVVVFSIV